MKKISFLQHTRWIVYILIILLLPALTSCKQPGTNLKTQNGGVYATASPKPLLEPTYPSSLSNLEKINTTSFIKDEVFKSSIRNANLYNLDESIKGVILPHHDVAAYMMGDLYSSLSEVVNPDVVYLIGPNHPAIGKRFQIGKFQFVTNSGILEIENESVDALLRTGLFVPSDEEVFAKEHSLNIHMNYIRYYFKQAKIVPILISEPRNSQSLEDLASAIYDVSKDQNCIFISSVDFSHFLTLEEANQNDEVTQKYLLNNDVEALIKKSNGFVDCPAAIVLMVQVLGKFGSDQCTILDHNNSANILRQKNIEATTSYFSVVYGD